jgi:hypothetical protein
VAPLLVGGSQEAEHVRSGGSGLGHPKQEAAVAHHHRDGPVVIEMPGRDHLRQGGGGDDGGDDAREAAIRPVEPATEAEERTAPDEHRPSDHRCGEADLAGRVIDVDPEMLLVGMVHAFAVQRARRLGETTGGVEDDEARLQRDVHAIGVRPIGGVGVAPVWWTSSDLRWRAFVCLEAYLHTPRVPDLDHRAGARRPLARRSRPGVRAVQPQGAAPGLRAAGRAGVTPGRPAFGLDADEREKRQRPRRENRQLRQKHDIQAKSPPPA